MLYRLGADVVVVVHFAFILFAVFGGFAAWRWRGVIWAHLPCAAWATIVELMHWVCPLTPLENWFRARAGLEGYAGGFVEQYLLRIIYPPGLTTDHQLVLGALVFVINAIAYAGVWMGRRRSADDGS